MLSATTAAMRYIKQMDFVKLPRQCNANQCPEPSMPRRECPSLCFSCAHAANGCSDTPSPLI